MTSHDEYSIVLNRHKQGGREEATDRWVAGLIKLGVNIAADWVSQGESTTNRSPQL